MTQVDFGQSKMRATGFGGVSKIALLAGFIGMMIGAFSLSASPAVAQNLFAPRLYVNDEVVTEYEVDQRIRFLTALRAPGDLKREAEKGLIDDRLRLNETKRLKLSLTPEERKAAADEFASRAGITAEQLLAQLRPAGIAPETYRDFVEAGALWRKAVRARFSGQVNVTELEVDRALEASSRPTDLKMKVSELVIPLQPGYEDEILALMQDLSKTITTEAAFSAAAREYSASPTAENGGQIPEWLPVSNLPPPIAMQLMTLKPGQTTGPLMVPNAVVMFQLRDLAKDTSAAPIKVSQQWAEVAMPNDPIALAKLRSQVDSCNDLYAISAPFDGKSVQIKKTNLSSTPQDVGLALAKLDMNEMALIPSQNGMAKLVMLCQRQRDFAPEVTREEIKERLLGQKLDLLANGYMAELRSAAIIRGK